MFKRITSITLAVIIMFLLIPFNLPAAASSGATLSREEVAKYLAAAYAAAADANYADLTMQDLTFYTGLEADDTQDGIVWEGYTLCPLWIGDQISFDHVIFSKVTKETNNFAYGKIDDISQVAKTNFTSACNSKYIISAYDQGDFPDAPNPGAGDVAAWARYGSLGVFKDVKTDLKEGFDIPVTYPIYSWANLLDKDANEGHRGFARLYCISNTYKDLGYSGEEKFKEMSKYEVSGYHLMIYIKLLHKILSDASVIESVRSYVSDSATHGKYEELVHKDSIIAANADIIWEHLKNYNYTETQDNLLYQCLTIATTQGAGNHHKQGVNDSFPMAADMFGVVTNGAGQDDAQRSFYRMCVNSSNIYACNLRGDDEGVYHGFVQKTLDKQTTAFASDLIKGIATSLGTNTLFDQAEKDVITRVYDNINGLSATTQSDYDKAAFFMFHTIMSSKNSWGLKDDWLSGKSTSYWTPDKLTDVLSLVYDHFDNSAHPNPGSDIGDKKFSAIQQDGGSVVISENPLVSTYATTYGGTPKKASEARQGIRLLMGGTRTVVEIIEGLRLAARAAGDSAENYMSIKIQSNTASDVTKYLSSTFGINNVWGLKWLTAKLYGKGVDNILKAEDAEYEAKGIAESDRNTHIDVSKMGIIGLLEKLCNVDPPVSITALYASDCNDTPKGSSGVASQPGTWIDGVGIVTLDDALYAYCERTGKDMQVHYMHYASIVSYYSPSDSKVKFDSKRLRADADNPLILNRLAQLQSSYDNANSMAINEDLKIYERALAMSNILDYYADQDIKVDSKDTTSLFNTIAEDIKKEASNLSSAKRLKTSYYGGSLIQIGGQDVYPYQLLLSEIIANKAFYVYCALMNDIIEHGGVGISAMQEYIHAVDVLHTIVDRYPSTVTHDLWYGAQSDDGKDQKLAKPADGEEVPIGNFSGLYEYLINMGLLGGDAYLTDIYTEDNPLSVLFTVNNGNIRFAKGYYQGRSLSASFLPMQTNTYDPYAYLEYMDTEWIETFQYNYGFHRKALMIDTNVDAAVDSYVTGTSGSTRTATLKDLLNPESDIVLYVDDNYYNLGTLAEQQDKAYDRFANVEGSPVAELMGDVSNFFTDMFEVRFEVALKQGEYDVYSDKLKENVSDMSYIATQSVASSSDTEEKPAEAKKKKYDDYVLTRDVAKEYLVYPDRYTEMMGFALVSMIYRDNNSYAVINNASVAKKPVFISSPTLATISGVTDQQRGSIYNYALLKNLPSMCSVGANQSLDMNSPIYTDIYGNIVTESGLVVIPAACNATIHSVSEGFIPMTSGFLAAYGKDWKIPIDWSIDEAFMNKFFIKNEEDGVWDIRNKTIQNVELALAELSYSDTTVNQALIDYYTWDINNTHMLDQTVALNTIHEVMRGAPIENINFEEEGLGGQRYDKSGLIAAAKLDSIINSLKWDEDNSIMSVPNLSFIDNYQYVVTIIFKILLVIVVVAMMMTVYIDVIKAHISWKTFFKCISILLLGTMSVLLVPVSYDIAYYQSNKALLQDEAEYILMLNTEKQLSGREIGISSVDEPKDNTKIYIKLEDYAFDWVEVLHKVIFSDSIDVLNEEYQDFLDNSLLCKEDLMQPMNDGIYVDVQDLFETSNVLFDTDNKGLYHTISIEPVVSHYLPYYYFLDSLILNVNKFNQGNNIYAYSTKIMRGGKVGTINLVGTYFNSKKFEASEDTDYLGLYQLYDKMGSMYVDKMFDESVIEDARHSQWYVGTLISDKESEKRIEVMNMKVKEFVAKHRDLIGKVTDETFLKVMAMSLALDYNDLYGIPSASAYEVYNLSNTDLMRLTVSDKATTLEDSPMSFARFVYTEAGTPGVYAAVFLVVVTMFVQTMKTIITIAIMVLLIVSVFVFKILLRRQSSSIAGYLLTLLVICSTNILYAVILKISLLIPQTGLAPTLCIIIQIIVQLAYLALLGLVLSFAVRDWRNAGFTFYQNIGSTIKDKASGLFHRHKMTPQERYDSKPRGKDGWDYYKQLVNENEKRIRKVGNH